jgi:hypothetical protein
MRLGVSAFVESRAVAAGHATMAADDFARLRNGAREVGRAKYATGSVAHRP